VSRASPWSFGAEDLVFGRHVSVSNKRSTLSLKDQLLDSALHGTATRYAAERGSLDESIEELREIADGRNDILSRASPPRIGTPAPPLTSAMS
jgi:hypothetical protein